MLSGQQRGSDVSAAHFACQWVGGGGGGLGSRVSPVDGKTAVFSILMDQDS